MLTSLKSEKKAAKPNKIKNLKLPPKKAQQKIQLKPNQKNPQNHKKAPSNPQQTYKKTQKRKKTANHKPNPNSFNLLGITEILEKI